MVADLGLVVLRALVIFSLETGVKQRRLASGSRGIPCSCGAFSGSKGHYKIIGDEEGEGCCEGTFVGIHESSHELCAPNFTCREFISFAEKGYRVR